MKSGLLNDMRIRQALWLLYNNQKVHNKKTLALLRQNELIDSSNHLTAFGKLMAQDIRK